MLNLKTKDILHLPKFTTYLVILDSLSPIRRSRQVNLPFEFGQTRTSILTKNAEPLPKDGF